MTSYVTLELKVCKKDCCEEDRHKMVESMRMDWNMSVFLVSDFGGMEGPQKLC